MSSPVVTTDRSQQNFYLNWPTKMLKIGAVSVAVGSLVTIASVALPIIKGIGVAFWGMLSLYSLGGVILLIGGIIAISEARSRSTAAEELFSRWVK